MLKLRTAKNTEIPITWIGISDFDGSLRLIFNDPEHTICLTRVFDEAEKDFEGFTFFKGIERMGNGCTVVRLMKG